MSRVCAWVQKIKEEEREDLLMVKEVERVRRKERIAKMAWKETLCWERHCELRSVRVENINTKGLKQLVIQTRLTRSHQLNHKYKLLMQYPIINPSISSLEFKSIR